MLKKILVYSFVSMSAIGFTQNSFDWSEFVITPPISSQSGNQILHFSSKNKSFQDSEEAKLFVEKNFSHAKPLLSDAEVLKYGSDQVTLEGLFLELGVCTGKTINFIAALNPLKKIYGFDSFEGLPEDWVCLDKIIPAKTFAFKQANMLPPVLHNVSLVQGWFKNTLKEFAKDHQEAIAFLHVDSDIYSSAATAFEVFKNQIVPGTIIVFDEYYNYPGYENHEYKAFQEFLQSSGLKARYLAYNSNHEQVAVQITKE